VDAQGARCRAASAVKPHANRARARRLLRGATGPLDEATAASLMSLYGVRRPREALVTTPAEAVAAARRIGTGVAIKAVAPEIPHKAKLGGVVLGLRGDEEVAAAADRVLMAARAAGARAPKVLVQEMVAGREVLVGAVVDERFGACVTIRPGGALAEEGRAEFVAAPPVPRTVRAFVAAHAEACGLDPARDDLAAVATAVARIARAAHDLRDRLISLEANPLVVRDRGAVAVDALAEARAPA
jgi:acetate---CoA ligase (ADP-forming)